MRCVRCGTTAPHAFRKMRHKSKNPAMEHHCAACRDTVLRQRREGRIVGEPWGADDPKQVKREKEAMKREREREARQDAETVALLRSQRLEIAGV